MKIFIWFLGIVIGFFTSCIGNNKGNDLLTSIDIGSEIEKTITVKLSELAQKIRYIPLEVDENNLVLDFDLFDFSEEYILASNMKICNLYDSKGRFIRTIGKNGRGPGEYGGISHVFLINNKVYLRNYAGDSLIEFDPDGSFIETFKSGFTSNRNYRLANAVMINDSLIFGNIENEIGQAVYKALIISKQGKILQPFRNYIVFDLPAGLKRTKSPGNSIIYKFEDKIFFKEFYNDTLFYLDNQYHLIPDCIFNFGKYKEPFSKRGLSWEQKKISSYVYLNNIFETNKYLFFDCNFNEHYPAKRLTPEIIEIPGLESYVQWYNFNGQSVLGLYNKTKRNVQFIEPASTDTHLLSSGLLNDIDAGPKFFPHKMVNDSTMVMKIKFKHLRQLIDSEEFKNMTPKYPILKQRLIEFSDSLLIAEFDNPILMFVTFKSN